MYSNGDKALILTDNPVLTEKIKPYLLKRYNLRLESKSDALETLGCVGDDKNSFELVILDENVIGPTTTSHVLKTIKDQDFSPNVLYLSTLHEMVDPRYEKEMEIPPQYSDEMYRLAQHSTHQDKMLALSRVILESDTIREVCENACRALVETFDADSALCVIPRFEENPPIHGRVSGRYPEIMSSPYNIPLKDSQYFKQLADLYKPIHVPDLNNDKPFMQELMDKFSSPFRSALVVPMVMNGKFLGYFGLFMYKTPRLFHLTEIDHCIRLADFAAAAAINIFVADIKELKNTDSTV